MKAFDLMAAIAFGLAVLFLLATMAFAGEHRTLEDVNRDINRYWAQQRLEAYQRRDQQLQEQQAESLRAIEDNTAEEAR